MKSIARIAVLTLLVATGMILIFCKDINADHLTLLCIINLIVKLLGVCAIAISWGLYRYWMDKDPWISKYEQWCGEADEARL